VCVCCVAACCAAVCCIAVCGASVRYSRQPLESVSCKHCCSVFVLCCSMLRCSVLRCSVWCMSALQSLTFGVGFVQTLLQCAALQCVALQCVVVQSILL